MPKVVGIKFREGGKPYDFDTGHFVLEVGQRVIVETEKGLALGTVATPPRRIEDDEAQGRGLKKIFRVADHEDLEQAAHNARLEKEAYQFCMERITERGLPMNLSAAEFLFDGSKIIFYFTAEGRVDFRELVKDLVSRLRMRVELRQIGVRHEAKMLGGLGGCGRELCCASFLKDFDPVSVKMAKEQNLALNPTKISGICGRLMCCLTYEYSTYMELKKGMPKCGKRVCTQQGEGKVVRQNVMRRRFTVLFPDGHEAELNPEDIVAPENCQGAEERPQEGINAGVKAGVKDAPMDAAPREHPPRDHKERREPPRRHRRPPKPPQTGG
jgi:cell fate regulator YaaT (PSP1 superfamily)